mgnify:FL=1
MTDKMQVNLRQVAMEILYEVQKNNGLLHVVLSDALKKYQYLDKNERSFISRLVQGTEERKIELDYRRGGEECQCAARLFSQMKRGRPAGRPLPVESV